MTGAPQSALYQALLYQALRAESVNEEQSLPRKPLSSESPTAGIR
jgi:hypothetical protein